MRLTFLLTLLVVGLVVRGSTAIAATAGERTAGRILIDVPRVGDAWYVYPKTHERYFLGSDVDAYSSLVSIAVNISGADIAKIPTADSSARGSSKWRKRMAGYFLRDMSARGKLWYVSPRTLKRKALDEGVHPISSLLRFGFSTSQAELRKIPVAAGSLPGPAIPDQVTAVKTQRITTNHGIFTTNQIILDRRNPHWQIMTDTGDTGDCSAGCTTLSVRDYVRRHNAIAGFQGTYFCDDGINCMGGINSYVYPVFNSWTRTMINQGQVKHSVDPMVIFDTNNRPMYLPKGSEFDTVAEFEARNNLTVQAALSNAPAIIQNGQNVLQNSSLDTSQKNSRTTRAFLGWKGFFIYFIVVRNATLPEATSVATAMGLEYAINLDGGGSTGMYNDGQYVVGPGRTVPNAFVILQR